MQRPMSAGPGADCAGADRRHLLPPRSAPAPTRSFRSDGRTHPQPRAVSRRAATGRGDRWATALTATALPEGQPYPRIYSALDALLAAIEAAPSASGWGAALVRYELLMLAELGFGLDLDSCAVSGSTDDLVAVSPRSGRAVSAAAAEPYAGKLLQLPRFVREGGQASWSDIAHGLDLTGHFLMRDLLTQNRR